MRWVASFDDHAGRDAIRKGHSAAHFDYLAANRSRIVLAGGLRPAPGEWYCGDSPSPPRLGQGAVLRDGEPVVGRDRVRTSHAGSLPRPDELIEANPAREAGADAPEHDFQARLRSAVAVVVRRQREIGIDLPGDGEFGKSMGHRVNYRAWWSYSFQRLGGLELGTVGLYDMPARRSRPGDVVLTSFADRRDRVKFAAAYADPDSGVSTGPRPSLWPVCVGPLTYTGHDAIRTDIGSCPAS